MATGIEAMVKPVFLSADQWQNRQSKHPTWAILSRLYEHLNAANETTSTALSLMSNFLYTNSGASTTRTSLMSVGLLARAAAQQVETLSYADYYLFMAMVGGLAFCFIPLLAPSVAAPKQAEQPLPSRIEKETPQT
jgi:hypothetical protein